MTTTVSRDLVRIATTSLVDDPSKLPRLVARHHIDLSSHIEVGIPAGAELLEWIDDKGIRRFRPAVLGDHTCVAEFVLYLSAMGEAILEHRGSAIEKPGFSVSALRFFFQQGDRIQEKYKRKFQIRREFEVSKLFRPIVGSDSVLPEGLGREATARALKWSVDRLLDRGQREAECLGCDNPRFKDLVQLGLRGCAQDTPIDPNTLSAQNIEGLIRTGLFDLGAADRPDELTMQVVSKRLAEAMTRQIDRDDNATFDRWFLRDIPNIVKQVSQRKSISGPIDRPVVRRMILELVFEGYKYTSQCLSVAMKEVLAALPVELTESEQMHFEQVFLGTIDLGDFPLVVLQPRLASLSLDPLTSDIGLLKDGVILRLLSFYGEMTRIRRHADRAQKRLKLSRNRAGDVSSHHQLTDEIDPPDQDEPADMFHELAAQSRERNQVTCDCGDSADWFDGVADSDTEFVFTHTCRKCHKGFETTLSSDVIERLRNQL